MACLRRRDRQRHGIHDPPSGGKGGRNAFEAELRRLGVRQKNSRPNHRPRAGRSSASNRPSSVARRSTRSARDHRRPAGAPRGLRRPLQPRTTAPITTRRCTPTDAYHRRPKATRVTAATTRMTASATTSSTRARKGHAARGNRPHAPHRSRRRTCRQPRRDPQTTTSTSASSTGCHRRAHPQRSPSTPPRTTNPSADRPDPSPGTRPR